MKDKKDLYKFGMDWLNGVLPVTDVMTVFDVLGQFSSKLRFERWELCNSGKYNYARRYCLDGSASIQLMYNPVSDEECFIACRPLEYVSDQIVKGTHNNSGIFFSISGDGLRRLADMGKSSSALSKLLFYFYCNNFRASRFDVYCDILDKKNNAVPIITKAFRYFQYPRVGQPTLVTNIHRTRKNCTIHTYFDDEGKRFYNCTLGGHGTSFGMFRCYNKFYEVKDGRLSDYSSQLFKDYGVTDYWYRLEYEIHKDNAVQCFNVVMKNAVEHDILSFEEIFFGCANRIFDIVSVSSIGQRLASFSRNNIWQQFYDDVADIIHFV